MTLDVERHEGDVLDLIKLHGSLDWLGLTDGTIIKSDKKFLLAYVIRRYEYQGRRTSLLRNRDKLKDDAIAHLSDQLIALTARLDSIEKR